MDQKFEYIKRKTYYIVHLSTIGEKENTRGSKTFYNKKENNLLQLLKHFTAVLVIFWIDLKAFKRKSLYKVSDNRKLFH